VAVPHIYDAFMLNDDLDVLECRLYELESIPNLTHVVVEADVTHQDDPKPSHLSDNWQRFSPWHDRIHRVWATGLPTAKEAPDPWAREHAQREWIGHGLAGADRNDVLLQSDVDEIPSTLVLRNLRPNGMIALQQRMCCFAVDWLHPDPWYGPVAARVGQVRQFGAMRDARNTCPHIGGGGWHFSWLGGDDANLRKLNAFCHPEVADRIHAGLTVQGNRFREDGWHVDLVKMEAVDVDETWPKWIVERRCPDVWWRPR
jgi:hypothetical protein